MLRTGGPDCVPLVVRGDEQPDTGGIDGNN
jgi:hypothetical protein